MAKTVVISDTAHDRLSQLLGYNRALKLESTMGGVVESLINEAWAAMPLFLRGEKPETSGGVKAPAVPEYVEIPVLLSEETTPRATLRELVSDVQVDDSEEGEGQ